MTFKEVEVLVVGAGPVGLVTALGLAQSGIKVLVIEKNGEAVAPQWRGSTIHPPTLEIFDQLGLAEIIIAGAIRVDLLQYRDLEIDQVVNFEYSALTGKVKFPFRLQFEQYKLLKLLRTAASENSNIELRYGSELQTLTQSDDAVMVKFVEGSASTQVSANWVVGADGSHSEVRKALGIELSGFTYPFPTTVVATPFQFQDHIANLAPVTYWSGPTGRLSMIRTPDIWRVAMTTPLDGVDLNTDDRGTIEKPNSDFIDAISLLISLMPGVTLNELQLKQYEVYRSHQRIATQFSQGRIALAGDAAHLTTTNGGMGLNSGVQDAALLVRAVKAAITSNSIDPITSYAQERFEFCEKFLQPTTAGNHKGVDNPDYEIRKSRLSDLSSEAVNSESELQAIARASMLVELLN